MKLQDFNTPHVESIDGVFTGLSFSGSGGTRISGAYMFTFGATSYSFVSAKQSGGPPVFFNDAGTVTITPLAATATPEPGTLVLIGTGLLVGVGRLHRRIV